MGSCCILLQSMKIWLKYLLAAAIGFLLSLFLSAESPLAREVFEKAALFVTRLGRYALYPVLFFSFAIGAYELRESRALLKTAVLSAIIIVAAAILCAIVGVVFALVFTPQRIPIFIEGAGEAEGVGIWESVISLFPASAFEVFQDGAFILPLCIFAGFIGAGCAADKAAARPVISLLDSFSRVMYAVMSFFVDMIAIGMIAISVYWFFQYRQMLSYGFFLNFILVLLGAVVFIGAGLYPLLLKIICKVKNPYKVLYASIAPVLMAFFSGDANAALPVIMRHVNESLGVRRRITAVATPMFSVFSRAGSALTVIISFAAVLRSHSSLDIAFSDMLWVAGICALFSFFLARFPSGGAYILLAAVCEMYGRGFEGSYLILRPAAFFICSAAAAIDALTAVFGSCIAAHKMRMQNLREARFFI